MTLTETERRQGGGPWQFLSPELDPQERWVLDFQGMTFRGKKGFFSKWLPLDEAQVTNEDTTATLEVSYNNEFTDRVLPNSVDSFSEQAFIRVVVKNAEALGGATIAAEDVAVSVKKAPYDADEAARAQAGEPWSVRALNDLIPGGLPGGAR